MAKRNILVHLDLNRNELQNAVLQNLAADPQTGVEGQKYYNTVTFKERIYSNGAWRNTADAFELQPATETTLGGIKVGAHLYMTGSSANDTLMVDEASTTQVGVIRIATDAEAEAGALTNVAITPAQLVDAIDAIPTPMHFEGSVGVGGTVEWGNLPSAASQPGYTYKVITKHTTTPVAEVGDTIISNGTEWVVIPSGDEPKGTVTSVGLSVPTGLQVSGSPITEAGVLGITLESGYEIPTTDHVKNFGIISDGTQSASANTYNDTILFKDAGATSVKVSNSGSSKVVTISSTDQNVLQSPSTDNAEQPILVKNTANNSAETAQTQFASGVTINPASGSVTAQYFIGDGSQLTNVPVGSHVHGNINADGDLTNTASAPGADDAIVFSKDTDGEVYKSTLKYSDVSASMAKSHTHETLTLSLAPQAYTDDANGPTLQLPAVEPWSGSRTPTAHTHGNITNDGKVSGSAIPIASGDAILIADSSDSDKLVKSSTTFDGASEDKVLSQKGTWVSYDSGSILNMLNEQNRTVAYKQVYENPQMAPTGSQCTWTQAHTLGSDVVATVKEASSGEEVYCEVVYSNNSVTIKMNATGSIAAGTYKVVLVG